MPAFASLKDGIGDAGGDQLGGLDGIVIAGNQKVNRIWIAIGVDNGNDRNARQIGLVHGNGLGVRIDDEHQAGPLLHVSQSIQVLL